MSTVLCFADVESTGLDPRVHQPYEVSWWREDALVPLTAALPHTLEYADASALQIGGYFDRGFVPFGDCIRDRKYAADLARELRGVTLVGSNPSFDAAMLTRVIGCPVWHHRSIDVSQGAMWVLGLVEVACLGYQSLTDDDVPQEYIGSELDAYKAGAADAARAILSELNPEEA